MTVSIKRAETVDAEALVRAAAAAFHYDSVLYPEIAPGGPPGYDSVAAQQQKILEDDYYKIVDGDQIIGGIVINVKDGGHCHLDLLFIAPDQQGRGIGTLALNFIEDHYRATKWTLDTPVWAVRNRHFYEKAGYVKVGEFQPDDEDIILIMYEKRIARTDA